ncbi:MAG TPA: ankyrin repeat domain-containing protein [Gemmatimonadaceae bacterium]|nr:ankyrin repeat domain-containing protein [Gemmatimonadaceae bacterium]
MTLGAHDQFIEAAFWHGSANRAQAILDANPSIANDFHVAAMLGDDDGVRRFLADDASLATAKGGPRQVDALTYLSFSAFLRERRERSDAFVRAATALLDAGASANTGFFDESHRPHREWESVLYGAAGVAFHAPLTRLLLERGADPNDAEVPYHSVEGPDNDAFQLLLDSGKLTRDSLNMMLLRKSDWHDYEGVELVLDHGADINQMSRFGRTALHHALISDNSLEIIDLLLDRGADPYVVARDLRHGGEFRVGRSSTAIAARRGRADVLASMARRDVPLKLDGLDVLIAACARGDASAAHAIAAREQSLIRELIEQGGELLAEFAGNDNHAGVALLVELGVPVDARYFGDGYFGEAPDSTALHVAAWRMSNETLDVLIRKGAAVDAKNSKGETPLMLAAKACVASYWTARRSPRAVKALLSAGASKDGVPIPSGYAAIDDQLI